MIKRLILPVGLILALLVSLVEPAIGASISGPRTTLGIVALIFLINGYQTHLGSFVMSKNLAGAFVLSALVSFVGGSLLGKAVVELFGFEGEIATGILVMSAMAPTLSSVIVITRDSGGNVVWSVLLTIGLNLLGIIVIPLELALLLSGTSVSLPMEPLLVDLILSVLVPFSVGAFLRHHLRRPPPHFVNLVPTLLVILLSYLAFCSGHDVLVTSSWSALAELVSVLLSLHLALFVLALVLSILRGYHRPERKAIAFLSSQKTLPMAVGILASLGLAGGAATLPCVIFHFTQILADSIIAARWHRKK